jgi:hypothetical protein
MRFIKKDAIRFIDIETGSTEEELLDDLEAIHAMPATNSTIEYYIAFASGVYQVDLKTYNLIVDYVELNYSINKDNSNLNLRLPIKKDSKHNKEVITLASSREEKDTVKLLEDLYSITINVNEKQVRYLFVFDKQYQVTQTSYTNLVMYLENKL